MANLGYAGAIKRIPTGHLLRFGTASANRRRLSKALDFEITCSQSFRKHPTFIASVRLDLLDAIRGYPLRGFPERLFPSQLRLDLRLVA